MGGVNGSLNSMNHGQADVPANVALRIGLPSGERVPINFLFFIFFFFAVVERVCKENVVAGAHARSQYGDGQRRIVR